MDGHRGNVHHIMSNFVTIAIHSCFDAAIFMAAEGKAIIFYRCNLFFFYFVSIDERPTMGSQPNLANRSEMMSIYKSPTNSSWGRKTTSNFGPLFLRL